MRTGVVLRPPLAEDAALAEALGFDLAWLSAPSAPAPLVAAAFLAPRTTGLRVAAVVECGPHPVAIAEEAAVADQALNGRLVLVLSGDDPELLGETADVVLLAGAARPFSHVGPRWRIPARLSEHERAEDRLRVTPAPAQLELPVWLAGGAAAAVAGPRTLSAVSDAGPGPDAAPARLRRPALRRVSADPDVAEVVAALRAEQGAWGLDVVVFDAPALQRERTLRVIAEQIRPRLQLDSLPAGLQREWDESRSTKRLVKYDPADDG